MEQVYFSGEYITLNQFLKIAGVVMTGGHGKVLILNGEVYVDGEQELRRGRKLRGGEVITVKNMQGSWKAEKQE